MIGYLSKYVLLSCRPEQESNQRSQAKGRYEPIAPPLHPPAASSAVPGWTHTREGENRDIFALV